MKRLNEWLLPALTAALLVGAATLLITPGGRAREAFDSWRSRKADRALITSNWIEASKHARIGNEQSEVALIEFSDYECPACRAASSAVDSALSTAPDLSIAYVNLPIAVHVHAMGAAVASVCAAQQGRFRAYHDRLFQTSEWMFDENWVREASAVGMPDSAAFGRCVRDPATRALVKADLRLAQQMQITATPTFFSRTKRVVGAPSAASLAALGGAKH